MARSFLCIKCNVEFPSDPLYMAHKGSGHTNFDQALPLSDLPIPTPPPGIPQEAMPSKEFLEQVQRIEGVKEESTKPSQHPTTLPEAKPLQLTYKYIGECPEHRTPVDTLELDIKENHFCIAFCSAGKHQVENKQVARL